MEKLLTAAQVADHLGLHVKTLYKLVRENTIALNFVRVHGRMIAFRPSDVERYIDLHEVVRTGSGRVKVDGTSAAEQEHRAAMSEAIETGVEYHPMTDEEAQAFFAGIKRDADGCLMTTPDESEY